MLFQLICIIKIRRAPTKHDIIDFPPLVIKASEILPISVTVADKGYDSEDNHVLVREQLGAFSVIPARHKERYSNMEYTWKDTENKQMKIGYPKILYSQRNKDETIISVIKRLFAEHLMSIYSG